MTDDVRKLLGGYATGTLTEAEQKELYEAALQDDALFAALADEHALKEMLDDSTVRAQVLQATEDPRFSLIGALREWFEHPKSKALVATGAVLLAVISFNQVRRTVHPRSDMTAELRAPASAPSVPAPSLPAPSAPANPAPIREAEKETRAMPAPLATVPARGAATHASAPTAAQELPAQAAAAPPPPPPAPAAPASAAEGMVAGGIAPQAPAMRAADATRSFRAASQSAGAGIGALERAAGTSVTPLRYELLRRNAAGDYQAVPTDYEFTPGDLIRLRVTSTRSGAIGVSSNTTTSTVSRAVLPDTWTEVPPSGGIPVTAETAKLVVAFAPSATDSLTSNAVQADEERAKRVAAPPVSLEIPIRLKKP